MSNPQNPIGRPAKPMSSRLMTMKFMQRAASSAAAASSLSTRPSSTSSQKPPPSPSSSSPSSLHPSKRPKPSSSFAPNSATTTSFPANTAHSELQAIREALAAEEAKRSQALERQAAEAGHETKWVLSRGGDDVVMGGLVFEAGIKRWGGRGFGVRRMGYSEIDAASSEEDGDGEGKSYYAGDDYGIPRNSTSVASNMMGRRSFGKFNRELEKRSKTRTDNQSSSSSDEAMELSGEERDEESDEEGDSDDSDDPVGANDLIRASKKEAADQRVKAARKTETKSRKAEAAMLAERRRNKEVKLNRLSSISGGGVSGGGHQNQGGSGRGRTAANPNVECYNCGEKGHIRMNCPKNNQSGVGGKLKRKHDQQGGGGGGSSSSTKRSKVSSSFS